MKYWVFTIMVVSSLLFFDSCRGIKKNEGCNRYGENTIVRFENSSDGFTIASEGKVSTLLIDKDAKNGIRRVLNLFQKDVELVTGLSPDIYSKIESNIENVIIVGEVDNCKFLKSMEERNKIDLDTIRGKWENSLIQTINDPFPGVKNAVVIAGSDKRGVIYGLFELSKQMGVSPWYWWADVPVQMHSQVYIKKGRYNLGEPRVQYRGIFINDEEPALGPWARETFGGFNAKFYDKVFELILRMKGNYLWPAMWGKAFADDDPQNAMLANEYGVVIGYSHHEPMMRAHKEWKKYGSGPWNYNQNKENLQAFWREGIKRNLGNESIVTIGMRGDGDEPMSDKSNIELLTQIVKDQRKIIKEETGKSATEVPQVWALYKEVQEYYDKGMRVDDDIMLLYCDDNWGNIRRLPGEKERRRKGGCGLYYHFDYVGGPRSYKWINTNPLPKIWEQNTLAYEYGVNKLWVVNVGDIKPMELPTQFYLDLAWDPEKIGIEELSGYTRKWSQQQFGESNSEQIAYMLDRYGKYAGQRKPEQLDMSTYSLTNYREFERITNELNQLYKETIEVEKELDSEYKDAYFQLVRYPIEALSNLYCMYNAQAKNHFYYNQKRSITNLMADSVEFYYKKDSLLKFKYHNDIANGKWNHMMSQTKIGYTSWNSPETEKMPLVKRLSVNEYVAPGLYTEGYKTTNESNIGVLPEFDSFNKQTYYFELFNKGCKPFKYNIKTNADWINISSFEGNIIDQKRIYVSIDWTKVPLGFNREIIDVFADKKQFDIKVNVFCSEDNQNEKTKSYAENNGYISIDASGYSKCKTVDNIQWVTIPDIGLTGNGITVKPSLLKEQDPRKSFLEYHIRVKKPGKVKVYAYFSPTLNFLEGDGLKYAISINEEQPVAINVHSKDHFKWSEIVSNNCNVCVSKHEINKQGNNILKFHLISPGLVLQKIVIDTGGLKESQLGPYPINIVKN